MTNAIKALIITWTKTLLVMLVVVFKLDLDQDAQLAVIGFADATISLAATLWLLLTAKNSPARHPDYTKPL